MTFYADLHVHSKFSRATSRECDLVHLSLWARKKGIAVLGTGDFTHPGWLAELKSQLVPAEPGLYRLRPELEDRVASWLRVAETPPTRFMLQVEISTIYKRGERTRKVHHLIYVPDLAAAEALVLKLARIGNLTADGRPILGLDSRDLLELTLESSDSAFLVPAHIWTPWFAVLGSKSGFDSIEECYGDLAEHIFAVETGLSSDPPMNWRLTGLDRYTLVSNSDAHSPAKLGREACRFDCALEYPAMRAALQSGEGWAGTVEFFPEEGKYHLDGHRRCDVRLTPAETLACDGRCPSCGRPLTVGVMHRVASLADRPPGARPHNAASFDNLLPLCEVLAELTGVGSGSRTVSRAYEGLLARVGPELHVLAHAPLEDLRRQGSTLLAEAVGRMREGKVICDAGYDGEYGVIRVFQPGELTRGAAIPALFASLDEPPPRRVTRDEQPAEHEAEASRASSRRRAGRVTDPGAAAQRALFEGAEQDLLSGLDAEQRAAADAPPGPLLIIAGPGTGKTRTLTHRIAQLVCGGVPAQRLLAITFTRRAAEEMRERLAALLPRGAARVQVKTFHALGLEILREHAAELGLPGQLRIVDEAERREVIAEALDATEQQAQRLAQELSRCKRGEAQDAEEATRTAAYDAALRRRGLIDLDDLIALPVELLGSSRPAARRWQRRYRGVCVDEFQDIDAQQYRLLQALVPPAPEANLCAIGDPDQAIYGFRGAAPGLFARFAADYPQTRIVRLVRNYRSDAPIVRAALQVVEGGGAALPGAEPRTLAAQRDSGTPITLHEAASDRAEAEFVVQSIEGLIGGHSFFSVDSGRGAGGDGGGFGFADFAVLYRTDAQSDAVVEAFERSGIPFQRRTHRRVVDGPLLGWLRRHLEAEGGGPRGAGHLLQRAAAAGALGAQGVDGAARLAALAQSCGEDVQRFCDQLAVQTEVDTWDPRADRVSLLTLHAAKGLEFSVVFLLGCEETLLPLRFGELDEAQLAEERRLMFVGMTRARERLLIARAQRRRWQGQLRENDPSRFLDCIAAELVQGSKGRRRRQRAKDKQLDLL